MRAILLTLALALLILGGTAIAGEWSAHDGDTLRNGEARIRLSGIDAPELSQTCRESREIGGMNWNCGRESRDAMQKLIVGGVTCEPEGHDRNGRTIATCFNQAGLDVGRELVRQGLAVAFRKYSLAYVQDEETAHAAKRGMWVGKFIDPSDWRAGER